MRVQANKYRSSSVFITAKQKPQAIYSKYTLPAFPVALGVQKQASAQGPLEVTCCVGSTLRRALVSPLTLFPAQKYIYAAFKYTKVRENYALTDRSFWLRFQHRQFTGFMLFFGTSQGFAHPIRLKACGGGRIQPDYCLPPKNKNMHLF